MSASVSAFIAQVRERGAELPPALSGALLLAAVRLSEQKSQALRPALLMVDDDGELSLLDGESGDGGYAAPELSRGHAPPRDPRVLVYAAGALGCELCTLHPPDGNREFEGPLGPVLRKALAPERKKRYRNLAEMAAAIEEIQSRPTHEEERLILAAVAQTSLGAKLARIELKKVSPQAPNVVFAADVLAQVTPKEVHPVFAQQWDPLEAPPEVFFEKPLPFESGENAPVPEPVPTPEPGVIELREEEAREAQVARRMPVPPPLPPDSSEFPALIEKERRTREEELLVLESRVENLARLGLRISALEQEVRSSLPPPRSLAQEVKQLVEERRFAEAEKALAGALEEPASPATGGARTRGALETDAVLQLRLGEALAGQTDVDGTRAARAEAAFRRAAELDPAWALPRALLGALLLKQGKKPEAAALLKAALALDPACAEARAALGASPRRAGLFAAAGAGAGAAALAVLALMAMERRPGQIAAPPPPAVHAEALAPPAVHAAALAPASPPAPPAPPAIEHHEAPPAARQAEPPPPPARVAAASRPHPAKPAPNPAAQAEAVRGDQALRSFDTHAAQEAFESALRLDPALPSAHRGMGMVYVLLGRNAEAKAEYRRYLTLDPHAADKDQIERMLSR